MFYDDYSKGEMFWKTCTITRSIAESEFMVNYCENVITDCDKVIDSLAEKVCCLSICPGPMGMNVPLEDYCSPEEKPSTESSQIDKENAKNG